MGREKPNPLSYMMEHLARFGHIAGFLEDFATEIGEIMKDVRISNINTQGLAEYRVNEKI